jgi:hypothetical protein
VDQFDHATVFNETTPHVELAFELKEQGHHVILITSLQVKIWLLILHKIASCLQIALL